MVDYKESLSKIFEKTPMWPKTKRVSSQLLHSISNSFFLKAMIQAHIWKKVTLHRPITYPFLILGEEINSTRMILQGISWYSWCISRIIAGAESTKYISYWEIWEESIYMMYVFAILQWSTHMFNIIDGLYAQWQISKEWKTELED